MNKELDLLSQQILNEQEAYNASLDKFDAELSKAIENNYFVDNKEAIILFRASIDTIVKYLDIYRDLELKREHFTIRSLLFTAFKKNEGLALMILRVVLTAVIKGEQKALNLSKTVATNSLHYIRLAIMEDTETDKVARLRRKYKRSRRSKANSVLKGVAAKSVEVDMSTNKLILLGTTIIDLVIKSGCMLLTKQQKTDAIYIRLSDEAKELLLKSKVFFGSMITVHYPFVVEPKKWTGIEGCGGYYSLNNINFIRTRNIKDLYSLLHKRPDISRLLNIVNTVQTSRFRVNSRVLDVVLEIDRLKLIDYDNSNSLPILVGGIPYNDKLNPYDLVNRDNYKDDFNYYKALDTTKTAINRIESKRVGFDLALLIAKKFRHYDDIYFSYSVDFRGRIYPIQQYLNPQGTEQSRALLEFSDGQVLTERGFYWLCIHGANCYGYDKLSYEDRIQNIKDKHYEILEVAKDPLSCLKYWKDADSPLLYLAFCFSYSDYIKDPTQPIHNVVQLDGTCSGIQMYSGLLLDKEGAEAVNVINSSSNKPSDIYGVVATESNRLLENNEFPKILSFTTKGGVERTVNTLLEAHSIKGAITRSITKPNVMTQPYSVTKRGMFEQIYDLLQEAEENNKVFWKGDKWVVASLITDLNDRAITNVVKGAKVGQTTLKNILSVALKEDMIDDAYWTTPIYNFPVLQRIKRETRTRYDTPLGKLVLYTPTQETHYLKMLNGIAPNFIHSLDATVLYRTVELCIERGVKHFWLIHDSFGVLPNDVDTLNECFRQAYVDVFSSKPLLSFTEQICKRMLNEVSEVMINTLNIEDVKDSKYIIT